MTGIPSQGPLGAEGEMAWSQEYARRNSANPESGSVPNQSNGMSVMEFAETAFAITVAGAYAVGERIQNIRSKVEPKPASEKNGDIAYSAIPDILAAVSLGLAYRGAELLGEKFKGKRN